MAFVEGFVAVLARIAVAPEDLTALPHPFGLPCLHLDLTNFASLEATVPSVVQLHCRQEGNFVVVVVVKRRHKPGRQGPREPPTSCGLASVRGRNRTDLEPEELLGLRRCGCYWGQGRG